MNEQQGRAPKTLAFGIAAIVAFQLSARELHCHPDVVDGSSLSEDAFVEALHIGPRKDAQRGIVRYRSCPASYRGDLPPRPAGSERLSLGFISPASAELTDESKDALATVARALRSDTLIGFGFRIEVSVLPSHDADADAALSANRAEAVASFLTIDQGLAPARIIAKGVAPGDSSSTSLEQVAFITLRRGRR